MANWKPDTIYWCGEFDSRTKEIHNHFLVMTTETDLKERWENGKRLELNHKEYVLMNRELDKKAGMVIYKLARLAEPKILEI